MNIYIGMYGCCWFAQFLYIYTINASTCKYTHTPHHHIHTDHNVCVCEFRRAPKMTQIELRWSVEYGTPNKAPRHMPDCRSSCAGQIAPHYRGERLVGRRLSRRKQIKNRILCAPATIVNISNSRGFSWVSTHSVCVIYAPQIDSHSVAITLFVWMMCECSVMILFVVKKGYNVRTKAKALTKKAYKMN